MHCENDVGVVFLLLAKGLYQLGGPISVENNLVFQAFPLSVSWVGCLDVDEDIGVFLLWSFLGDQASVKLFFGQEFLHEWFGISFLVFLFYGKYRCFEL